MSLMSIADRLAARVSRYRRRMHGRHVLKRHPKQLKLHIGCGQVQFQGWVHLDADTHLPHLDAIWHAEDGLPCDDATCDYIYNEHFLEHLSIQQGMAFLRECRRVLRPDGVLRVAMPDMRDSVGHYLENDWQNQPWMATHGYTWIQTGCEYLNVVFRDWGHQWLYDREELHRRLVDAGFSVIRDMPWGHSDYAELRNRETRTESILICEATP